MFEFILIIVLSVTVLILSYVTEKQRQIIENYQKEISRKNVILSVQDSAIKSFKEFIYEYKKVYDVKNAEIQK